MILDEWKRVLRNFQIFKYHTPGKICYLAEAVLKDKEGRDKCKDWITIFFVLHPESWVGRVPGSYQLKMGPFKHIGRRVLQRYAI